MILISASSKGTGHNTPMGYLMLRLVFGRIYRKVKTDLCAGNLRTWYILAIEIGRYTASAKRTKF